MRNVSRVRKVRLEDVVRVSFDAMEKVIVSCVEQVGLCVCMSAPSVADRASCRPLQMPRCPASTLNWQYS